MTTATKADSLAAKMLNVMAAVERIAKTGRNTQVRLAACHPDRKHHARGMCYECYHTAYNAEHRERIRAYMRKHYHEKPTEDRARAARERLLRTKYRVTQEWVDERLAALGDACSICRRPFTKTPHIDHSHSSGKTRDLVCAGCNSLVGALEHPLRPAAEAYLRRFA